MSGCAIARLAQEECGAVCLPLAHHRCASQFSVTVGAKGRNEVNRGYMFLELGP